MNDAGDARAFDNAGENGVDADVFGAELFCEALGEADHAPFCGGIGRAEGIAEAACGGGEVDDGAAASLFEHWHGMMGAEILAGEADIECATPFLGADFINAACGACNAGIVDENIEAAE